MNKALPVNSLIPNSNSADHLVESLVDALNTADSEVEGSRRSDIPNNLLERANDLTLVRYTVVDWLWIGSFWLGMAYTPPIFYPLWVLLIAGRIHAFGVTLHDAIHKSFKVKNWKLRFVEIFAGYSMASTLNAMRYHHIRHHRDSGMPNDPYFDPAIKDNPGIFFLVWLRHILLMPAWIIRGYYGSLAYFIPAMRNSYARIFMQEKSGEDLTKQKELINCAKAEFGQASIHTIFLAFAWVYPYQILLYYFIPGVVAGLLGGYRVLIEHNYTATMDRSISTIINTTRDHHLGHWGRLFLAPRNIGYHIVHHIHPQVALENLPALRQWYIDNHSAIYPSAKHKALNVN